MDDLISRQAALDAFGLSEKTRKYGGDHSGYDTLMFYKIQNILEALPPACPDVPDLNVGNMPKSGDKFLSILRSRYEMKITTCI